MDFREPITISSLLPVCNNVLYLSRSTSVHCARYNESRARRRATAVCGLAMSAASTSASSAVANSIESSDVVFTDAAEAAEAVDDVDDVDADDDGDGPPNTELEY